MHVRFAPLLIATVGLTLATATVAVARDKPTAGLYESYGEFSIAAAPVLPAREVHPSLWFKADDVPVLRARLEADEFMRTRWAAIQKLANLAARLPTSPQPTDKTEAIHKYYGAMSIAARAHALVALLVSDESARSAHQQRATELLLRAYDGPIFELDSKKQGSPVDEIYRGSWLQNYAAAYDCIQPSLTPEQDRAVRGRLTREAECVFQNLYAWAPTSPHNHLSKPAWGLGSIALTLSDDPRAKAWLGRAIEAANRNTRYFFSGDGIYREGNHYLIFSLTNFLPFLYHYRNVSGVDAFPAFQPVFETMVATRNSRGWLPNIADSYLRPTPTHLAAVAYRTAHTRLHSSAPLGAVLAWSYATCDLAPFEGERKESGLNYTGASWDYPLEIDELLTHDPALTAVAPDASPNVFLAGGQTVLRNAWHGQRYLLFHGVARADNHQHDDLLSFVLEAEGQMMCSDSGYSRGTYTGAERTNWYLTAPAHNVLTFDGRPARDFTPNQTAPSLFQLDQPTLAGEEKAATFGEEADWHRAILEIAGDYYVIADRINAPRAGAVAGYFHAGRGELTTDGARHTWRYAADRYGAAAQLHAWIAAPEASVTVKRGELTYIKGDYAEFPYLQIDRAASSIAWLTLLKPAATDDRGSFVVEDVSTADCSAFAITAADHTCLVATQPSPGARRSVRDIEFDGTLVVVRRDRSGRLLDHRVFNGTRLVIAGREVWRAETPQLPPASGRFE